MQISNHFKPLSQLALDNSLHSKNVVQISISQGPRIYEAPGLCRHRIKDLEVVGAFAYAHI